MPRRGGSGGGRHGRRSDYPSEQHPSVGTRGGPPGGRSGHGSGRGGSGRGRSVPGEGGDLERPVASRPSASEAPSYSPPSDAPSSSSAPSTSAPVDTILSQQMEQRLVIRDPAVADTVTPTLPPASSKALRPPARPGFGTVGRRCVVRANHFLVEVADKSICHYDVAISPESTSRNRNRRIIVELVTLHKEGILGRRLPVYDGRKSLYTAGPLPFEAHTFVIELSDEEKKENTRGGKRFEVTIKHVGKADLTHLWDFLHGRQMDAPQETIQALDVVLRETPSLSCVTVSRSFFSTDLGSKFDIGDGLECWRGFYQSLRPTQMGLSLNTDICATSFYKPVSVVDFVAEYLNLRDTSSLSNAHCAKIKKALRRIKVEVIHNKDSRRRYTITGISSMPMNRIMFSVDEQGTKTSVVQYFRDRYNYSLKYVTWPCLQAGSDTRPTYLPMEVCKIVEGQRFTKKLNERQVTKILRETCQRPQMRENNIYQMVQRNKYNDDKYLKEFGIRIDNKLTSVEARVLPPPKLKYHDSGREKICSPNVGQWNMINKRMVNGGKVEFWTCINFSSRLRLEELHQFCFELVGMCNNIGMDFNPKPIIDIQAARPDSMEPALRQLHDQSIERFNQLKLSGRYIQMLIIIMPEMSDCYGRIKRICETELGIVSQCCLSKHVMKGNNKQYLENVALKINVKVGGRNTVLEDALYKRIPLVTDMPTIIFGADVTHPAPGEDSSPSIAAVVASIDWPEVTKYKGLISAQQHRMEIIQDLYTTTKDAQKGLVYGGMIRELLLSFYSATRHKPGRIIFYRDGVSEGQFSQVLLHEVDAIRKACVSLQGDYVPPITFVVVQKRHHTRLFPEVHGNRDSTDRSGNILPGTVVDKKICHPTEFDFFLCSHAGIQGTSRPTHYHVLFDENRFTADGLQILTNNLCYTYARCTRSVSVVPPAYYAHLAAFRARYYMESELSDGGSSSAGGNSRTVSSEVRQLPTIKDNVKSVMFFC